MLLALTARTQGVNYPLGDRSNASGPTDPMLDVDSGSPVGDRQVEAVHEPSVQVRHEGSPRNLSHRSENFNPPGKISTDLTNSVEGEPAVESEQVHLPHR